MRRPRKTTAGLATLVAVLAAAGWLLWPTALGGRTSYVDTHGISMQPRFHTGDLALLRPARDYHVGDVVAYHSSLLHTVVMHRIVAISGGHYTFKGDNNSWLDPQPPTRSQLIGKLALRIPHGGVWLKRAASPAVLGVVAFTLLASGGTVAQTRRTRRRRTVSRHAAARTPRPAPMTALAPPLRAAAGATTAIGMLGLALAALAWTAPVHRVAMTTTTAKQSMVFSYTATVPKTPAYDTTVVTSPDPIFRKLTHTVDIHYAYHGTAGSIAVTASLSTASGWRSTIPLATPTTFSTSSYHGTVRLDLDALDARAQAAARATGIPVSQLAVTITPTVRAGATSSFAPTLPLTLTPLQLTLAGDSKNLTVTDSTTLTRPITVDRTLGAAGHSFTVATGRRVSTGLVALTLLAALLLLLIGRRSAPNSEGDRIRSRYPSLLVPVAPMPTPPGRPVIDVTDFTTLARLAERYGLLVLHWTRSGVDTFVVQDDATTYRYRAGTTEPALTGLPATATATRDPSHTDAATVQ
jgi:signal peptidase I